MDKESCHQGDYDPELTVSQPPRKNKVRMCGPNNQAKKKTLKENLIEMIMTRQQFYFSFYNNTFKTLHLSPEDPKRTAQPYCYI